MFTAMVVLGTILMLKGRAAFVWLYFGGISFFLLGVINSELLKTPYLLWMRFAFVLSWVNTRIILALLYYLVITPVGLLLRLFRKDLLDTSPANVRDSYWHKKEPHAPGSERYERQF